MVLSKGVYLALFYFVCVHRWTVNVSLQSWTGCYIGHMFVGALAYADDLVLLAPTPHAVRCMLQLSAEYAKDYDVLFNADI